VFPAIPEARLVLRLVLRLWPRLGAAALAVALVIPAVPASASPEDDLAQKREEAAVIERQISENGTRISVLDEEYNVARIAIEQADAGIVGAEAGVADAEARAAGLSNRLAGRAARMYIQAGAGPLAALQTEAAVDLAARGAYGAAAAEQDNSLIDELDAAREDLDVRRAELEGERASAQAKQEALTGMRDELDRAQVAQEELLAGVEGDIAGLVSEIEAKRRADEEERARQEFQRRAQEEAERSARTTTTTTTVARAAAGDDAAPPSTPKATPTVSSVPAPNANAQIAVDTALAQLGKPYKYAGKGPDSFDCSGLTGYAWKAAGVQIPHSSQAQYDGLPHVSISEIAPGDLLFYGSPIHHVGVYTGNDQYVHAPQTGDVVKISSIFRSDFAGAARPG